jgi:hypothetical protein
MLGSSSVAAQLAASQEGLSSMSERVVTRTKKDGPGIICEAGFLFQILF